MFGLDFKACSALLHRSDLVKKPSDKMVECYLLIRHNKLNLALCLIPTLNYEKGVMRAWHKELTALV